MAFELVLGGSVTLPRTFGYESIIHDGGEDVSPGFGAVSPNFLTHPGNARQTNKQREGYGGALLKTILNFIDISTAHPKPPISPWMEFRNSEVFAVVIKEVNDC